MTREDQDRMEKTGRIKWFKVSRAAFTGLFRAGTNGQWYKIEGLPADAEILAMSEHACFAQDCYPIRVWSSDFPVVPASGTCPELELTVTTFKCPDCNYPDNGHGKPSAPKCGRELI